LKKKDKAKEIYRKSLHTFGLTIWFVYEFFNKNLCILYVLICLSVFFIFEVIRLKKPSLYPYPFKKITEKVAREREKYYLAAHIHFFIGALIALIIFRGINSIVGILVAIFSDAIAAIVGVTIGRAKIPINKEKTVEGTLTGMVAAMIVIITFLGVTFTNIIKGLIIAIIFGILDVTNLPVNDNLIYPIIFGGTLSILDLIF